MLPVQDVLLGLQIVIAIVVLIVLYHVLFIVVDARKIVRRVQDITSQVEGTLLKPLSFADQGLDVVVQFLEAKYKEKDAAKKKKKSTKKKKSKK
ncbi:hypothetical protein HN512_02090 [Candidatus Peregrinibacteria bacterium]|jgi:cell shape-determining protein MreC|nr:hypothetical protein [Candidatus Peregrinibacteria bacterium]MBT3598604.1 hypothetical protein [Candidatus Peregrinibacteria bacterium]MBT4367019.1 hypothetical protein [Candidatus Peregrinibacteria bacterium]MBT4586124.1 hypothetical protein [Candidatus Peregrinibacteria bacterium]MBT6730599.1 hypothetical protein [Candidatus Peregrinibacteria bacterium]